MFNLKPYCCYETVAIVDVPNITFSLNFKSAFLLVLLTNFDYFEVLLLCLLFWRKKRETRSRRIRRLAFACFQRLETTVTF